LVMPASVQPSIPSHLSSGIPPSALSNSTMLSTMPSPVPTTSHALNNATMPSVPRLLQLEMHYILHLWQLHPIQNPLLLLLNLPRLTSTHCSSKSHRV
jgi:hypothetical protein